MNDEQIQREIETLAAEHMVLETLVTSLFAVIAKTYPNGVKIVQDTFDDADKMLEVVVLRNKDISTSSYKATIFKILEHLRKGSIGGLE